MNEAARNVEMDINTLEGMDTHAELIRGRLVIRDYTSPQHSRFELRVAGALEDCIRNRGLPCRVYADSVALLCDELSEETSLHTSDYYLPDVMAVCTPDRVDIHGVHTAPRFISEITSPGTRDKDYCDKMIMYRNIGVPEYWIIDLQEKRASRYLLEDGYVPAYFIRPDMLTVQTFPGLDIRIGDLWDVY